MTRKSSSGGGTSGELCGTALGQVGLLLDPKVEQWRWDELGAVWHSVGASGAAAWSETRVVEVGHDESCVA